MSETLNSLGSDGRSRLKPANEFHSLDRRSGTLVQGRPLQAHRAFGNNKTYRSQNGFRPMDRLKPTVSLSPKKVRSINIEGRSNIDRGNPADNNEEMFGVLNRKRKQPSKQRLVVDQINNTLQQSITGLAYPRKGELSAKRLKSDGLSTTSARNVNEYGTSSDKSSISMLYSKPQKEDRHSKPKFLMSRIQVEKIAVVKRMELNISSGPPVVWILSDREKFEDVYSIVETDIKFVWHCSSHIFLFIKETSDSTDRGKRIFLDFTNWNGETSRQCYDLLKRLKRHDILTKGISESQFIEARDNAMLGVPFVQELDSTLSSETGPSSVNNTFSDFNAFYNKMEKNTNQTLEANNKGPVTSRTSSTKQMETIKMVNDDQVNDEGPNYKPSRDTDTLEQPVRQQPVRLTRSASRSETPPKKVLPPELQFNETFHYVFNDNKSVDITPSDYQRLDDNEFLNDTMINFYLKLFHQQLGQAVPDVASTTYIFNTFFFEKLTHRDEYGVGGFEKVKKWTAKVDIFKMKYVIIPIHSKMHWYLAVIYNLPALLKKAEEQDELTVLDETPKNNNNNNNNIATSSGSSRSSTDGINIPVRILRNGKEQQSPKSTPTSSRITRSKQAFEHIEETPVIFVLDSLRAGSYNLSAFKPLREYIASEAKDKKNIIIDKSLILAKIGVTPQQNNYCDCGVYLIHYAERFLTAPEAFLKLLVDPSEEGKQRLMRLWQSGNVSKKRELLRETLISFRNNVTKKSKGQIANAPAVKNEKEENDNRKSSRSATPKNGSSTNSDTETNPANQMNQGNFSATDVEDSEEDIVVVGHSTLHKKKK